MTTPHFISISGVAGSGKTTVSNHLKQFFFKEQYEINEFSFAGPLKDALCLWFGWDRKRLDSDFGYKEGSTLDDGTPDPYCEALGLSRRQIMQKMGTECMRQGMHQNFWIIMADLGLRLGKIRPSDLYIISDARFINELEWAKSINAYRIFVKRVECLRGEDPDKILAMFQSVSLTSHTGHASETQFIGWNGYDATIINMIDRNVTDIANMNKLVAHLDKVVIPEIRERFGITRKGPRNWNHYRGIQ
jgi:hypothetical protein